VGVWKFIRKGWDSFSGFTRFVVGDDFKINFWHDLWCGDMALKVAFPTFFGIARAQDASVADKLEFLSGANQWNAGFSREAHDWEVDAFAYFLQALHSIKVGRDREDKLWWVPSKKGCSRSNLSFAPWPVLEVAASIGKVCGALKSLQGRLFLHGQRLLARFLPWIILGSGMLL
jgi:hypothetical protein